MWIWDGHRYSVWNRPIPTSGLVFPVGKGHGTKMQV